MGINLNFSETKGKKQFSSVFGLKKEQFDILFNIFEIIYRKKQEEDHAKRQQTYEEYGMKARLRFIPTALLRTYLLVVLYYLRHYPTFEVLGWNIATCGQRSEQIVQQWFPYLVLSLEDLGVIPPRTITDIESFIEQWEKTTKDLLIDVTERRINRPQEGQKEYYSGKKKCHSIKNTIICLTCLVIVFLGPTHKGSRHDFGMFKEEGAATANLKGYHLWVDLGYQGIKKLFGVLQDIFIPFKKPRKTEKNPEPSLTDEQKSYNKSVSQTRIYVEHAIGRVKIFKSVSHKFRGRRIDWDDDIMVAATALHNFKMIYK